MVRASYASIVQKNREIYGRLLNRLENTNPPVQLSNIA